MSIKTPAIKQLTRTTLGAAASTWAAVTAGLNNKADMPQPWLLNGVVWQYCPDCDRVCYPARPLCPGCLSGRLDWCRGSNTGRLLASTSLHSSFNAFYRDKGPWPMGIVAHESGTNLYVFLENNGVQNGEKVALFTVPDAIGEAVFVALKPGDDAIERAAAFAAKRVAVTTD